MARRESNIRVSIVVPHLGDDSAFESSLISVLENRPPDCEVWVAHDGNYNDPFDLGDEVRFVTHKTRTLPALVGAAADVVHGRFVHVIAGGIRATDGWVEAALEKYEHPDAAIVAPVARRQLGGLITAAGWTSSPARLTTPIAHGKQALARRDPASIRGVCLAASFWRREELRSATRAFVTDSAAAAQFAWSRLLCRQGWRCILADQSNVLADEAMLGLCPSLHQGLSLRSLESEIKNQSMTGSAISVGIAAVSNLLRPRYWGEVTGEAISLVHRSASLRPLQPEMIRAPEDVVATIRLPRPADITAAVRRAA